MSNLTFRLEKVNFFEIESPLLNYRYNKVSQDGEDGIIERMLEIISPINNYCVEFGAWDGKYFSNCYNLIEKKWHGCFIEGNSDKYQNLIATYSGNNDVICLNKFVEFEGQNSLDNILHEISAPVDLDFISIDVDGNDYYIWESLTKYQPRSLVIEFNPTVPNDVIFVQAKSNKINQGCSLHALIMLGKEKGYELVCCTGWNAFFVKKELFELFGIKNNTINSLYQPICDGRIFHGYDSEIFVTGMPKLIWSNIDIDSRKLQVLPKYKRHFRDSQR